MKKAARLAKEQGNWRFCVSLSFRKSRIAMNVTILRMIPSMAYNGLKSHKPEQRKKRNVS